MPTCNIPGGPIRSNLKAYSALAASSFFKISSHGEDLVEPCSNGDDAIGICLEAVEEGEILNMVGHCFSRKTTGTYEEIDCNSGYTVGNFVQSGASGVVTTYASGEKLGVFLNSGTAHDGECRVQIFAK